MTRARNMILGFCLALLGCSGKEIVIYDDAGGSSALGGSAGRNASGGSVGHAGSGTGGARQIGCRDWVEPVKVETVDSCDALLQTYEITDADRTAGPPANNWDYCDAGHGSASTSWPEIPASACSPHVVYAVLRESGHDIYGCDLSLYLYSGDLSAWDGLALWVRAAPGTRATFSLGVSDSHSKGQVINAQTGEKTCYTSGDDWDFDGVPNSAPPPDHLSCTSWQLPLTATDQWKFLLLPWSAWQQTNTGRPAATIDPSSLDGLSLSAPPCYDLDLELKEILAYRRRP